MQLAAQLTQLHREREREREREKAAEDDLSCKRKQSPLLLKAEIYSLSVILVA